MQIDSIDEIQPDVAQSESPETNPFNQALAEIESQLNGLTSAFTQLDALQTEEQECIQACEQIAAEERTVLENPNGSTKKAAVDRLVRIRATRDLRNAKLTNVRKRIAQHTDLLVFDLAQPLRSNLVNLSHALLAARRQRIETLFHQLLGNGIDHGLPVSVTDLAQRSKPVLELQRFCNWVRDARKDPQEELVVLRSELPRRWLTELRSVIAQEQSM